MGDEIGDDSGGGPGGTDAAPASGAATRRTLMLGAAGASMVVTIRPALAQTAGSILTCEIPVPDPRQRGQWINVADGTPVPPRTEGAVRPPPAPLKGEDVRRVLREGGTLRGASYEQTQAYTRYIQRLQNGMGGFTCYASLQSPRG